MSTRCPVNISRTSAALLRAARLLPVGSLRAQGPAGPTREPGGAPARGPLASDPASAVARVLLSEWPYWGPRGSPGRPQPSAVRLLGTFSGSSRSWAPLLPAHVLGACHSVPPAIRPTFPSVPVALSPWNCPPPNPPSTSLSLSLSL